MYNLLKDISTVTTVPLSTLTHLSDVACKCISHAVVECIKSNQNICTVDIGIGTLSMTVDKDDLQFKFVPSMQLQKTIFNAVNTKESELVEAIEDVIKQKVVSAYKNFL